MPCGSRKKKKRTRGKDTHKRLSKSEYQRYEIKKGYFRNNPRYGRTTKIKDKQTGKKMEFMGTLTKSEAIKNFKYQKSKRRK